MIRSKEIHFTKAPALNHYLGGAYIYISHFEHHPFACFFLKLVAPMDCALPSESDRMVIVDMLHGMLKVDISDGRRFVGRFQCLDQHMNLILTEAKEFSSAVGGSSGGRSLGMILLPGGHICSINSL
jgi:small nuclear ribonucleoprotein (snRNP)-like protein